MRLEITSKNMDELTDSDISDIEYILESNSNSTFFHSLEYLRVIRKVSSLIPKFIIARKGDKALGYFPFFSKPRYKIFREYRNTDLEMRYGGPLAIGNEIEVIKQLVNKYEEDSLGLIWYIKTHNLFNIEILNEMQYSTEIRKEAVLNIISNEDKMWMNLKGRTRRAIRKSVKNGVQLYEGKDSDLDKYYEMVCETYKRSNSQPPPKKLIFEAYRILFPVKMIKLFFAEYNGELIAALMPTIYKKKIYYWGGADLGTHRNLQPMSFLFWELIKWAKSNHHQKLDFLGIDNPRFEKFKCSWGGSIESHHSCVKKSRKLKFLRMFLGRR